MDSTPLLPQGLKTEEKPVFVCQDSVKYRIPALFYDRDTKTLLAFAEKRKTLNDASAELLVMNKGVVNKDADTQQVTVTWSNVIIVKEAHKDGHHTMNPCPVYEKTSKKLFLFFVCVRGSVSEGWQRFWGCNKTRLCYITTSDGGQTWSKVTDLTESLGGLKDWAVFAVGPGHGLQATSSRLIVPLYAYASCSRTCCCIMCSCAIPYALCLYSDDQGTTWKFGDMLEQKSVECEMAEFADDKGSKLIYCNARNEGGYRVEAVSHNDGGDFGVLPSCQKLVETGKIGCQGSVVSFPAQNEVCPGEGPDMWLLYTHPTSQSHRKDLGVYLNKSPKDPNAWSKPWIPFSQRSAYSDLAYIDDGWFACLMECGTQSEYEQIACAVFSYQDVKQGIGE